jgi:hypothetical protein
MGFARVVRKHYTARSLKSLRSLRSLLSLKIPLF